SYVNRQGHFHEGRSERSGLHAILDGSAAGAAPVMVTRRGRRAVTCSGPRRLVLCEAVEALLVELRISYRAALLADAGLTEPAVAFQQPVVMLTLDDVPPRGPVRGQGTLRAVGHDLSVAGVGRGRRRRVSLIGLRGPVGARRRRSAAIWGQAGPTGIGTRHSHRVPAWITGRLGRGGCGPVCGLRVWGRQGRDPGQASWRKGEGFGAFGEDDRWS